MSIEVSFTPMSIKPAEQSSGQANNKPGAVFTDAAAAKVKKLVEEEGNSSLKLRVVVSGGGCSGFQYGFEFDENVADDDVQIENAGVIMLVDAMSMRYLQGAEVDYKEDLEGARFIINNPNAKSTCGCGSSFSI
jgi:iron-sulfur cluster insertion protein